MNEQVDAVAMIPELLELLREAQVALAFERVQRRQLQAQLSALTPQPETEPSP